MEGRRGEKTYWTFHPKALYVRPIHLQLPQKSIQVGERKKGKEEGERKKGKTSGGVSIK